jgi:hypothetical protein
MSPTPTDRKQQFLDVLSREHERTMRVLRAFPAERGDLRPHPRAPTARDLAWVMRMGESLMVKALTTGFDWAHPTAPPPVPASIRDVAGAVDEQYRRVVATLEAFDEARLDETVQFFTGPKTLGEWKGHASRWMTA